MSSKFYENALKALKKANKARKLVLAGKAGYDSVSEYQMFLESMVADQGPITPEPSVVEAADKPVIYVVDVIDCSGSMSGGKLTSALKGINHGIQEMKKEKGVQYKHVLCDFSGRYDINLSGVRDINSVPEVRFTARGMTALNDAVLQVLDKMQKERKQKEKVLVNIYTDGHDNESRARKSAVSSLVKKLSEEGFTITFIGTEIDTKDAITNFGLDASNTVSYDGTAEGLAQSMTLNSMARSSYAKKVVKGEDVKVGFFKEIKK